MSRTTLELVTSFHHCWTWVIFSSAVVATKPLQLYFWTEWQAVMQYALKHCKTSTSFFRVSVKQINAIAGFWTLYVSKLFSLNLITVGVHLLRRHDFMRALINSNKTSALSLHYNWNNNKEVKRKFLEQMGDWYAQETCIDQQQSSASVKTQANCCAREPLIRCHYRDKASVIPCRQSPSFSENGESFW